MKFGEEKNLSCGYFLLGEPYENLRIVFNLVFMTDSLEQARQNIDQINEEIVEKVDERMAEVLRIVEYKDKNDMDVKDEDREEEVMKQFADRFEEKELPRERGRQLGRLLIDTAVDLERTMLGTKN